MNEPDKTLETLLEDVKTIKTILQNEDAPLPRVWIPAWTGATAVFVAGLLQYFVPFFRDLDFDGKLLWLWLPGACLFFPFLLTFLYREMDRTGKKFLGQGRVRHLLYARFVVPPAALVLIWLASRNTAFSLEGTILIVVAIWQTVIEQLLPEDFKSVPFVFLGVGLLELGFNFRGPEATLFNVVLVAATIGFAAFLFRRQYRATKEQ